jgi:hypothetical protein
MKKLISIIILLTINILIPNNNAVAKRLYRIKGTLHITKSPRLKNIGETIDKNRDYNKMALNQRPSLYSTGKKDNIFDKVFRRKTIKMEHGRTAKKVL